MQHRFTLEKGAGAKKHICPRCTQKTLTRYIDNYTGEYLNDNVGICSRIHHCTYHLPPRDYFRNTPQALEALKLQKANARTFKEVCSKEPSLISWDVYNGCLRGYGINPFIIGLASRIGNDLTNYIIELYRIGTSKLFGGSVIFPQIDIAGNIRSGKIMKYNPETIKRGKVPPYWLHKALSIVNFNLGQCFFGEHLLKKFPEKKVMIVESEKSACIGTARYPQFLWLATGGLSGLNPEKCFVLADRSVTLIPDLGVYDKWESKLNELRGVISNISITDYFEKNCSIEERERGDDIADFILKFWDRTATQESSQESTLPTLSTLQQVNQAEKSPLSSPAKVNVNIGEIDFLRLRVEGIDNIPFHMMCKELTTIGKQEELDVEKFELEKNNPETLDFDNLDNYKLFVYAYEWGKNIDNIIRPNGCMGIGFSFFATAVEQEKVKNSINSIFRFPNMILATVSRSGNLFLITYVEPTPYTILRDPDEKFPLYRKYLATKLGVREEAFYEISGINYSYHPGLLVNNNNDSILSWESLKQRLIDEIKSEKR